ncbi:hypothetical protein BH10PSE7_BH10PSE7_28520 [soil metagenome]
MSGRYKAANWERTMQAGSATSHIFRLHDSEELKRAVQAELARRGASMASNTQATASRPPVSNGSDRATRNDTISEFTSSDVTGMDDYGEITFGGLYLLDRLVSIGLQTGYADALAMPSKAEAATGSNAVQAAYQEAESY